MLKANGERTCSLHVTDIRDQVHYRLDAHIDNIKDVPRHPFEHGMLQEVVYIASPSGLRSNASEGTTVVLLRSNAP